MNGNRNLPSDVIDLRNYQAEVKSTPVQNDLSYFDVRRYLPPGIQVNLVEKGGSLFVPHRINEFSVKVVRRKIDLVVFQCMLRYTLGFQRPAARLSNSFIGNWTGLEPSNVRRALRSLKEMGLVVVLSPGTASSTTLYDLPIVRGYLDWRRNRETDAKGVGVIVSEEGDQSNPTTRGNEISKKENLNKTEKKTLSATASLPHQVLNYIESVKPHQKRVEEEYHLHMLLQDYPVDDLVDALMYVQVHGALDTGERVHSPLKYLSYTAEEVIPLIHKEKEKATRREEQRKRKEFEIQQQDLKRQMETDELTKAIQAFAGLPLEKRDLEISNYKKDQFGTLPHLIPPTEVVEKLVAVNWFRSTCGKI